MNRSQHTADKPLSVLIVDDIEQNLYLLNFMLTKAGYHAVQAANGKQALALLERESVDLIVSDILMPEMDGYQFCRTCKANDKWKDIPFIFYTATYTTEEDKAFALGLGASRFIIKPQEPEIFLKAVEEVFAQLQDHQLDSSAPAIQDESEYLTLYNQRLVKKLEDKLVQLEERNQQLSDELAARKTAESRVEMLKQTLEQTDEGVLIFDNNEQLVYVNQAYTDISGVSHDTLMRPKRNLSTCPGLSEFCRMNGRHALIKKQRWNGPLQLQNCQGASYPSLVSAVPIHADNQPIHLALIIRDISKFKLLESQFHEAQKMDAVGKLAGGIAHDFNNMLAAISMNAYLMRVMPGEKEDMNDRLEVIESACEHSSDLTRQLLTFARKDNLKMQALDLNEVVNQSVKLVNAGIRPEIRLVVHPYPDDLPLRGNRNQIEHMLINLLNNAIDAVAEIDEACIEIGLEKRSCQIDKQANKQHYAMVTVSDNGCGISAENLDHIFEPFMTTKEVGKGTGLGLAMVHGAMENHFGHVEVQSDGDGTRFSLFFPLNRSESKGRSLPDQSTLRGNGRLILLADDNPYFLEAIGKILRFLDFKVLYANDGCEAVALFSQQASSGEAVAAALLDVAMPKKGGVETAQALLNEQSELPILFTTGYAEHFIPSDLPGLQHARLLVKPFAMESLCNELSMILNK